MKLSNEFIISEIAGQTVLMPADPADYMRRHATGKVSTFSLSPSAKFLVEALKGKEFTLDDAVAVILDHYDADEAAVRADVTRMLDGLKSCGAVED